MSDAASYPKVAQLKDVAAFRARLAELGLALPIDERVLSAAEGSPLAQPMTVAGFEVGNRWCIHPMEGWDANRDGSPSRAHAAALAELRPAAARSSSGAARRRPSGPTAGRIRIKRWPPRRTAPASPRCSTSCTTAHREAFGSLDGLLVGLQLTHSGRFCKPDDHHKIRAADRLSPSAAGRQVQHRPARRLARVDRRRARPADRRLRRRRPPRPRGRLSLRRREGLPRLSAARVPERPPPARPLRRRPGRPHRGCCSTIIDRIRDELPAARSSACG